MTKNEPLDMKLINEIKDTVWKNMINLAHIVAVCWLNSTERLVENIQVIRIKMTDYLFGLHLNGKIKGGSRV